MGFEGARAVMDVTGEYPVYPGHPLTIAWEIISVFKTPTEALQTVKTDSLNCPEAVADNRITGAGGEVYRACELLRRAQQGIKVDDLIAWADECWVSGCAGGYSRAVQPGLEQAERLKPLFAGKLADWLATEPSAA